MKKEPGKEIGCTPCSGSGQIWQPAEGWSDECAVCGGSGTNWLYPGGAIAKYYSGPLIGKLQENQKDSGYELDS